jgi:TonB family protein
MLQALLGLAIAGSPGALDEEMVSYSSWIQRCRLQAWRRQPDLAGTVVVRFEIERDGQVSRAELASSELADARAERCLVRKVQRMWFSAPEGGGEAVATYPFLFAPR